MLTAPAVVAPIADRSVPDVGHAAIDAAHQEFMVLLDRLRLARGPDRSAALDALVDHAWSHFADEDALMRRTAFPATECHRNEHAAVLNSMQAVRRRHAAGEDRVVTLLVEQLAQWFPAHVDHLDSALAHWICKQRHGAKPLVLVRRFPSGELA